MTNTKMSRVFIIANGEPDFPDSVASVIAPDDIIICADGGSNHAAALGIRPNIVVGDMDSISDALLQEFQAQGTELRKYPRDKDSNDLELALQAALELSCSEILCLSILGRRQDHSLTNTFLLGRYASLGNKISILGSTWQAQFVTSQQPCTFNGAPGDIFSLTPMVATVYGVTVKGVKWALTDETLPWGGSRTVSNEFLGDCVSVTLNEGIMLAFHYRSS